MPNPEIKFEETEVGWRIVVNGKLVGHVNHTTQGERMTGYLAIPWSKYAVTHLFTTLGTAIDYLLTLAQENGK